KQIARTSAALRAQEEEHDTALARIRAALGQTATALDDLGTAVTPEGVEELQAGLLVAADYLDRSVTPAAEAAGRRLAAATPVLRADVARLREQMLLRGPLDLQAGQAVYDSLGELDAGLAALEGLMEGDAIDALADRALALGQGLQTAADQIDGVASMTNPLAFGRGKPQPIWPEGKAVAQALRTVGQACAAAAPAVRELKGGLPAAREWVEGGRR